MTLNELTTEIAKGHGRELDLQYRQSLVPQINHFRSRFIRNSLGKNPKEKSQFMQSIIIPLTYGDYVCGDFVCKGSYSEVLPDIFRIGDTPFEYLGATDGSSPYRSNDIGTDTWINQGMTADRYYGYNLINKQVIIKNKRIDRVMASAIFDEPEKAMEWQCKKTGQGCDWWNSPYPITGDIYALILTTLHDLLKENKPEKQDQDE